MQILIFILSFLFLFLNYKIIKSDIKYKKIPNKYLLYLLLLLPLNYFYLFYSIDLHIGIFLFKILLATIISFILYSYGIWSAGDAKYLLVLSLFIPHIGIIPFIGNIALLTITYLSLYFLYFYLFKLIFKKNYRKLIFSTIYIDNKEKFKVYFIKGEKGELKRRKTLYKIIKGLLIFLTIFVILRLSRLYIIEDIKKIFLTGENNEIKNYISNYISYIIAFSMFLTFFIFYFFKLIYKKLYGIFFKNIIKKFNIDTKNIDLGFLFLLIILFFTIIFILYEYKNNGNDIIHKLYLIFTIYLGLYFIIKILFYLYKITFQTAEFNSININELKTGDIVDKNNLIRLFQNQEPLYEDGLLNYEPRIYLKNITNPINQETKNTLQKIYKTVSEYHIKNKTKNFQEIKHIKTLNTFAFGGYILGGFIITLILQDKIFKFIFEFLYEIIRNFYH